MINENKSRCSSHGLKYNTLRITIHLEYKIEYADRPTVTGIKTGAAA
jgi:hypothetical protein